MRDWQAEKGGVRWGESRNGCPPPAGKFAHDEKLVYIAGYASSFAYQATHCHANETAMAIAKQTFGNTPVFYNQLIR